MAYNLQHISCGKREYSDYFFLNRSVLGWGLIRIISRNKGGYLNLYQEEGLSKTDSVRKGMNRQRTYFNWDHLKNLYI